MENYVKLFLRQGQPNTNVTALSPDILILLEIGSNPVSFSTNTLVIISWCLANGFGICYQVVKHGIRSLHLYNFCGCFLYVVHKSLLISFTSCIERGYVPPS